MDKIRVQVFYTGLIDIKNVSSGEYVSIEEGSTLSDLFSILGIRPEHKRYIIPMVNDQKEFLHYILKDDDQIKLFLPVGGG